MIEVFLGDGERRAGPMVPEVSEIGANGLATSVDELVGQRQAVKGLIPELGLGVGIEHPAADTG